VSHDSSGLALLHALIIVTAIEVAAIALPVVANNLLDVNEGFLSERQEGEVESGRERGGGGGSPKHLDCSELRLRAMQAQPTSHPSHEHDWSLCQTILPHRWSG
jgi:hypothetical protein